MNACVNELDATVAIADRRSGAELATFGSQPPLTSAETLVAYDRLVTVLKIGPLREVVHVREDSAEVYTFQENTIALVRAPALTAAFKAAELANKLV